MSRKLINPAVLHPTPGFSHIAVASGSRLVFLAGQTALAPDFSIIGAGDLHQQTLATMKNVKVALDEVSATWSDVVRRTVYTTQPTEFQTIAAAISEVTGGAEDPPQTIVGVTGLAVDGLLIEIECTVVLD
ncbi:MAG: Enamine/imine deaminase [Actinobacteria bacterium ADurb.Bin444]|nr:MAG: Enamine/imine deaminase [Actinobacteria bacterium ADurb.Bin444]